MSARAERALVAGAIAVALVVAWRVPTYPNYDSYTHLVWGRQLLDGTTPGFRDYAAPTPHPGLLALCALLDLVFGGQADRALVLICVACFVVLVWAVFRVGRACFGAWPGAVAAVFCGSSIAFLLLAARAYVDVPFLALVLAAAALEAERPVREGAGVRRGRVVWRRDGPLGRAGRPVGALLAVAGLLRPEAWLLAGAYWLWAGPRRLDLVLLAAVAPVVWALVDLVVTGDPLFSLHATSALAEDLGRDRGIAKVPGALVSFLADTARPPVLAAALLGMVLVAVRAHAAAGGGSGRTRPPRGVDALRPVRARALPPVRAVHVPAALAVGGVAAFVVSGGAGLSILPRYLTVPAVALCLFAGYAVAGFTRVAPGRLRRRWAGAAAGAAVLGAAFLVVKLGSFTTLAAELRFIARTHRAVVALAGDRDVARCGRVSLPTYRLVPDLRFELDGRPPSVAARTRSRPGAAAVYVTGNAKAVKRFGQADGVPRATNALPPRADQLARHDFLAVLHCGPPRR